MSNDKKSFQISLAWAERELLRSNSIHVSEPMELQNWSTSTSFHSREIEIYSFLFWIPSIVTWSVIIFELRVAVFKETSK